MLYHQIPVLKKEYRIRIGSGTVGQNIDSLIEDFKIIGEIIDEVAVKKDCIAIITLDTEMRWGNRAKQFNPEINLISVWETTL